MAVKPKLPMPGLNKRDAGEVQGNAQPGDEFAQPRETRADYGDIKGMESLYDDIGEKSGFQTEGYIVKKGTPYGEAAKFNFLPPGMDITNQENTDQRQMPLKKVTEESYAGDGWEPMPRDIPE